MSLPLTKTIDPDNYEQTTREVIHEFLSEYFNQAQGFDAEIRTTDTKLESPLTKPVIFFALSSGIPDSAGNTDLNASKNVVRGEYKNLSWDFLVATDNNSGGELTLSKYVGYLDSVFRKHQKYLAQKGLRNNSVSVPISVNQEKIYQKLLTVTNRLLLTWEVIS